MLKFKIYQVDSSKEGADEILFRRLRGIEDKKVSALLDKYKELYDAEVEKFSTSKKHTGILEDLFRVFNVERPDDFQGHSLSVSDIVKLYDGTVEEYWYCDSFGWSLLEG